MRMEIIILIAVFLAVGVFDWILCAAAGKDEKEKERSEHGDDDKTGPA